MKPNRKLNPNRIRFSIGEKKKKKDSFVMAASKLQAFLNHPAGPKTIHFWAPTFKWGISIANIADFAKPPEKLSYPQQIAVTATGLIWSRYSTVITPKNWNLFSVNVAMAGTGIYQLSRKLRQDYFPEKEEAVEKE
ncbi:mitochondrial pyruvate carrier [Trifolium repens]|nr:mitochondrial pyruvate carrier [Trifolium repens]